MSARSIRNRIIATTVVVFALFAAMSAFPHKEKTLQVYESKTQRLARCVKASEYKELYVTHGDELFFFTVANNALVLERKYKYTDHRMIPMPGDPVNRRIHWVTTAKWATQLSGKHVGQFALLYDTGYFFSLDTDQADFRKAVELGLTQEHCR